MSDWTKRNARALLREFRAHGLATETHLINYHGEDLRGQTFLADESLAGADFHGVDLSDAQFIGGVNLAGADLSSCRLVGARLDRANLVGANLTGANLDSVSLIGADLRGATLDGTRWRRARLTGALMPDGVPPNAWGAAPPSEPPRLEMSGSDPIPALSWHPDGDLLAVARGSSIEIWDPTTATTLTTLEGHTNWVWAVAWSPDGTRLATSSTDNTVRVSSPGTSISAGPQWSRLVPRRLRQRWIRGERRSHDEYVAPLRLEPTCASFTTDLTTVAVGSTDGSVSIVPLDQAEPTPTVRLLDLPDSGWPCFGASIATGWSGTHPAGSGGVQDYAASSPGSWTLMASSESDGARRPAREYWWQQLRRRDGQPLPSSVAERLTWYEKQVRRKRTFYYTIEVVILLASAAIPAAAALATNVERLVATETSQWSTLREQHERPSTDTPPNTPPAMR